MSNIPKSIEDLLFEMPTDPELMLSNEEMEEVRNSQSFETIFNSAKKRANENNEELIKTNNLDDFIFTLSNSVEKLENIVLEINEAVLKGNKEKINQTINMFNRTVHSLKGQVYSCSAYTLGDILHAIEDITTQNMLESRSFKINELYDFLKGKIEVIKNYVYMIKNDTYEVEVNKNKRVISESKIKESKSIFVELKKNVSYLNGSEDKNVWEKIIELLKRLENNANESRYKNFLIYINNELMALFKNIDLLENRREDILQKERKLIKNQTSVAKEMFDLIIKGNSDYYNIAMSNLNDTTTIKKKVYSDKVSMDVSILNNILVKLDEVKIETTQVENTIKTSEMNIKNSIFLLDALDKAIQYYETYSNNKIQAINNDIKQGNEMFDPLEMDNYTELQEKTRIFKEVLLDLKNNILNEEKNVAIKKNANKLMESALQKTNEALMSTRLKSVKSYLGEFIQNTVSTAAKDLNKEINLQIIGDNIEVDSVVMGKLKDPLMHTLRNSVSHGIEDKAERINQGKPEIGKIICHFEQKNGKFTVTINDDGAGINVKKVEEKAREKGIWTSPNAMTDKDAVDVICMPNFSTQDVAHQVSGRGVGMDAVKNEIIKLNGRYDITSRSGKGLDVLIQIPTSLSNKEVLLVNCAKQKFAIPTELFSDTSIFETNVLLEASEKGRINFKGQEVDFRYLSDLVGIKSDRSERSQCNYVLLLSDENGVKIAVAVEKITKDMITQVPVKTIGRTLSNVPGIVATTILSDGKAAFIYDPVRAKVALLKHYGVINVDHDISLPINDKNKSKFEQRSKGLVMVVDDSPTVRKQTVRLLEKVGYNHITAVDGEDAKSKIINVKPDIILLDLEMPRMDGFQFTEYLKENEKYEKIPIIMLTSRSADKHRDRATKLGINKYMTKPFQRDELLAEINKLLKSK